MNHTNINIISKIVLNVLLLAISIIMLIDIAKMTTPNLENTQYFSSPIIILHTVIIIFNVFLIFYFFRNIQMFYQTYKIEDKIDQFNKMLTFDLFLWGLILIVSLIFALNAVMYLCGMVF